MKAPQVDKDVGEKDTAVTDGDEGDDIITFEATEEVPETSQYLQSPLASLDQLELFQTVKRIHTRCNTTLPSSASVERLFSCAGLIMTPLRTRVTDANFEAKVLLNFNKMLKMQIV